MKKILTLIVVVLCCGHIFAQSETTDSSQVRKQGYGFYKNYSHWSLAVSGGFNLLMGERDMAPGIVGVKNYKESFLGEFNFEAEYGINPIWGIALNYAYAPIAKGAIFLLDQNDKAIYADDHGQGHQVYALLDINLLNLFSRYRKHTEWGWYGGIGLGVFMYNTCKEFITDGEGKWSATPMIPIETRVEYSPISSVSFFLKATLGIYLSDAVNVYHDRALNDWNLYGGLGLRWNINATKKPHVRVTDVATYQNTAMENGNNNGIDTAAQNKIKDLEKQLKDMQDQMGKIGQDNDKNKDDIDRLKRNADKNKDDIRELRNRLDTVKQHTNINTEFSDNSVYFKHNSWKLSDKALAVIEKVARIMKQYPDLQLEITSFCSKIGSEGDNVIVGENRIKVVVDILVEKYNIDRSRISGNYNGQVFKGLSSENRRCDLKLR